MTRDGHSLAVALTRGSWHLSTIQNIAKLRENPAINDGMASVQCLSAVHGVISPGCNSHSRYGRTLLQIHCIIERSVATPKSRLYSNFWRTNEWEREKINNGKVCLAFVLLAFSLLLFVAGVVIVWPAAIAVRNSGIWKSPEPEFYSFSKKEIFTFILSIGRSELSSSLCRLRIVEVNSSFYWRVCGPAQRKVSNLQINCLCIVHETAPNTPTQKNNSRIVLIPNPSKWAAAISYASSGSEELNGADGSEY